MREDSVPCRQQNNSEIPNAPDDGLTARGHGASRPSAAKIAATSRLLGAKLGILVDTGQRPPIVRSRMTTRCQLRLALMNAILLAVRPALAAGYADYAPSATISEPGEEDLDRRSAIPAPQMAVPAGSATQSEQDPSKALAAMDTLPLEEPIDPERYICGPGDVFQLNFWGRQNLSVRFVIDPTGRAFVPKVGYASMAGQSLKDASEALRKAVARFYPKLNFDFSLVKPRTFLVHVVGSVKKPGIYSAHATDRLTKVLTEAGGRNVPDGKGNGSGSLRKIEISRRGGEKLRADLLLYDLQGDTKNNPYLNDGDVIVVPYEGFVATIDGAVQRPGRYELVETKDIAELVKAAGGLRSTATRQLPIEVSRRIPGSDQLSQLRFSLLPTGEPPHIALASDDRVHIPSAEELQRSVMLVGAIAGASQADEATGIKRMPFVQGDTVRTLVERAGGVGVGADYKGSYIVRVRGTEKSIIPLDLEALLIYRDLKADRQVEIGDVVNVPYQRHAIMVEGAVLRPGVYQFNPRLGVQDYIAIAGGPSKMAQDTDSYRLVSPKGKAAPIDEKTSVQPGDTLVVPERHFSRAEITQIIIASVTLAVLATSVGIAAYSVSK